MPFNRIPEITALISTIDTAMARADDIGNDIIRDLMPDLRDAIDEINAALREVDGLLFEGLRDEAVALHDDEFSALASRLNLEDREGWPELERFFVVEGISPPPKIDYDTLSALESAHAELEELRRPLDKLRRMALERAPVARRLSLLRKLREADPTKPVWTQAINDHEQVRVAELHQEARRVLAMRDPQAVAALHAELVDPDWGIPIPRELVKATRGAEVWMNLRAAAEQAKEADKGFEAAWQQLQQGPPTATVVEALRRWRMQYDDVVRLAAESQQLLADCPTVAGLIREERLVEQIDGVAPRIAEPLNWLAIQDAADAAAAHLQQVCGQLEYLCRQKPDRAAESAWLNDLQRLTAEAGRLCASQPGLVSPDALLQQVDSIRAGVLARSRLRRRLIIGGSAAGVVATCLLIVGLVSWLRQGSVTREDLAKLQGFESRAHAGEFVVVPPEVAELNEQYPGDDRFRKLVQAIEQFVGRESSRRQSLEEANREFDQAYADAKALLKARQGADRLTEWPESVVAGARAWRNARRLGGEPSSRVPKLAANVAGNDAVRQLHAGEEATILDRESKQKRLEGDFDEAASAQVREQVRALQAALQGSKDLEDVIALQNRVDELLAMRDEEKTPHADELLEKTSELRYSFGAADQLQQTRRMIQTKAQELSSADRLQPPSSSTPADAAGQPQAEKDPFE
jgi:hypothetical protein